jgi:hypothetical protein
MKYLTFLCLLSLCVSCAKADILLEDAKILNKDALKMEIDAENPAL